MGQVAPLAHVALPASDCLELLVAFPRGQGWRGLQVHRQEAGGHTGGVRAEAQSNEDMWLCPGAHRQWEGSGGRQHVPFQEEDVGTWVPGQGHSHQRAHWIQVA